MDTPRRMLAELLDAMPDPLAELELRRQQVRDAYAAGRTDGYSDGVIAMASAYKRGLMNTYANAQLQSRRWHVCCRSCRQTGHRDDCGRCEDRSHETYRQPHPDDFQGRKVTAA